MKEIHARSLPGLPVLLVLLVAAFADVAWFIHSAAAPAPAAMAIAALLGVVLFVSLFGL